MKIDNRLILEYSKNLNVLYVEDDEELRQSTVGIFKNYFSTVDTAVDGADGLEKYNEYFQNKKKYYDLVISDINMPVMNGIEFASIVLSENYEQAVVFITAHNEIEYLQRSIDLGINGFITKPIKMEQLKKVFYKVTQAVYDRKTVSLHYEIIKKFNAELKSKNEELEKSLRVLNTIIKKEQIVSVKTEVLHDEDKSISSQISLFVSDNLEEIKELHKKIDINVISVINNNRVDIKIYSEKISHDFAKYASIMASYSIFDDLSASMEEFSVVLKNRPSPADESNIQDIFILLESFMFVLGKWSEGLESSIDDTQNFLDTSLISDMKTIISMWTMK